ncbi:cystatin-A1-like isoform X1 [Hyperolius riggenbachi]|uniref:cystatin-A1-like isoform X1 n=1 Tax=Hyperolius riggenbachi TaxID=752182 RepID=UPI0035A3346C
MCQQGPQKSCPPVAPVHLVGGFGDAHPGNKEVQTVFNTVKADFLKKSGVNASEFRVISYTSQVVAGTNYIAKVQCGPHSFAHLKVYAPLPHTKKPAELVSFQLNKSEKDQLGSF